LEKCFTQEVKSRRIRFPPNQINAGYQRINNCKQQHSKGLSTARKCVTW